MHRSALVPLSLVVLAAFLAWWLWPRERAQLAPIGGTPAASASSVAASSEPAAELAQPAVLADATSAVPSLAETAEPSHRVDATDAALADAHWLAGRVALPAETPADEEAWVVGRGRSFEDRELHRVRVAPDGRFRVAFAPRSRHGRLVLEARYLVQTDVPRIDLTEPAPAPVEIACELGARLVVRAVPPEDATDAELADLARTELRVRPGTRQSRVRLVPPRELPLGLELERTLDALPCAHPWTVDLVPGLLVAAAPEPLELEPGRTHTLEIPLVRGATLEGRVTDEAGAPIADAWVLTRSLESPPARTRRTTTDAHGAFRLVAVAPGETAILADHADWRGSDPYALGELRDGETRSGLELVLRRGVSVAGTVVGADGAPVPAGVQVMLEVKGAILRRSITGAGGAFAFEGLEPAERFAVVATTSGGARGRASDVLPDPRDVLVRLGAGARLTGRVEDPEGRAAPRATLRLQRARGRQGRFTDAERTERVDDPGGAFELEGLAEGGWLVYADARGCAPSLVERVELPQRAPLVLALRPLARLAGRVVDEAGRGQAGARVRMRAAADVSAVGTVWDPGVRRVARTTETGAFELERLAPGPVLLFADAPGRAAGAPVHVDVAPPETSGVELVLFAAGALEIELHSAIAERAGRRLQVAGPTPLFEDLATDGQGRARVDALAPGEYAVVLLPTREAPGARATVPVTSGATARVVLGRPGANPIRLEGTVRRAGAPVAGAALHVLPLDVPGTLVAHAETDAAGRYAVELAAPGRHRVLVRADADGDLVVRTLEVPAEPRVVRDLELGAGTIRGRVTDASGAPVADHAVRAWRADAEPFAAGFGAVRAATTAADGTYALDGLDAGSWCVAAGGAGDRTSFGRVPLVGGGVVRAGLELEEEGEIAGVELVLAPAGAVEGTVVDASGAPAGPLWLIARDAAGELLPPLYGALVGGDGRLRLEGLPAGEVTLVAYALTGPGTEPTERGRARVSVHADDITEVTLRLER